MDQGNPPDKTDSRNELISDPKEDSLSNDINQPNDVTKEPTTPSEDSNIEEPNKQPQGYIQDAIAWFKAHYLTFRSLSNFHKSRYIFLRALPIITIAWVFFGGPTKSVEIKKIIDGPTKYQLIIHTDYPVETKSESVLELFIDQDQKTNRDCEILDSSKGKLQSFTIKCTGEPKDTIHYELKTKKCGTAKKSSSLGDETHIQYACK